jgi:tRNA modification GTPase
MDTIFALSSGSLPAGVAVLRVSGSDAASRLTEMIGRLPAPGRLVAREIRRKADGALLDRGLVLWKPGPASFTGEDLFELHLHGSIAVVSACFDSLAQQGCRMAEAGEFTRRAFHNGKLDLTQVEGLADLLSAQTEMQRRQALEQSHGALRREAEGWLDEITSLRAEIEVRLDFSDEGDVSPELPANFWVRLQQLRRELGEAVRGSKAAEQIRHGYQVVLAGAPNAGKSSLMNALAGRDVAIVTAEPGTTRDLLEVNLDLRGLPVRLRDTAGIREPRSEPEQLGIDRAWQAMREADLVLWLSEPGDASQPGSVNPNTILVATKADLLPGERRPGRHHISVRTGEGLDGLLEEITQAAVLAIGAEPAVLSRQRHRECVTAALEALDACGSQQEEIVAHLLQRASDAIGQVTGRVGVEQVLDRVFAEFCIGK